MKTNTEQHFLKSKRIKTWMYVAVLLVNLLVFACIGMVYNEYASTYQQKLYDENIKNVESLSAASANAAGTYITGMNIKISDLKSYIERKDMSFEEAVDYLCQTNIHPERQFQLARSGSYGATGELSFGDYTGVSVRVVPDDNGGYSVHTTDIAFGSSYYDIFKSFTDINDEGDGGLCYVPEFTDPDTKLKCFAVYRHVVLRDEAGQRRLYTILQEANSLAALNAYNMQGEYEGQSSVLINEAGDYIIKNSDYRNANFFDYIVNYNDLTLDMKETLHQQVRDAAGTEGTANLFYKNNSGDDCVFSLSAIDNGWYSITCVPLSSFDLEDDDVNYSLVILLLFAALFVLDGVAIYFIGRLMNYNVLVANKAKEQANQASKAKSRFLSTMSHELRTPLNAIIGLTALSADSIEDPPVLADYLKKIDISSKLLLQLISDILDVSAIESNKMKLNTGEFDISKLIASLSAIYYDQCAAKGVEFNVVLKDMHQETLVGDSVRVNQVLLNFLSNAVKFTSGGGSVTLRAEQVSQQEDSVLIRFDICDTGCGISDELKGRLFRPFERANGDAARKYSGTGLGLSIAKNLTELMGGKVGMESREGEGSRFWAEIPFGIPERLTRRSFSPIGELSVLAAIGNADEREYIGQILSGFGLRSELTDSATAALKLLRERRDEGVPFSVCFLDWKLPDLTALDAAQMIRAEFDYDKLKITILAYDIAEAKPKCLQAGADYVFGKPIFPSSLYNFLSELTTGKPLAVADLAQSYDLGGRRVLLVEDNKMNIEVAGLLLKKIGLEAETALNGQLGFERFAASEPGHFDAILMDVQMPVMNGYDATRAIRACSHPQAKTIPILAMTADAFSEDVDKARAAGMNEHLSKPIEPGNLYSALKKYLSKD